LFLQSQAAPEPSRFARNICGFLNNPSPPPIDRCLSPWRHSGSPGCDKWSVLWNRPSAFLCSFVPQSSVPPLRLRQGRCFVAGPSRLGRIGPVVVARFLLLGCCFVLRSSLGLRFRGCWFVLCGWAGDGVSSLVSCSWAAFLPCSCRFGAFVRAEAYGQSLGSLLNPAEGSVAFSSLHRRVPTAPSGSCSRSVSKKSHVDHPREGRLEWQR
jgi:hypothetical protein